ncbi:MAG TPA: phenylalanine--tRNA ligase subunit alpha, partial [Candidatus Nanopelagicaceae bacterium]|nr:phenylalanine--tRNA ligase subunit alpha [Candidatus Nanopelagicaceae bacterium]
MTIKLKKQVIEILEVIKKKNTELLASELANDLNIDYIVLMAAVNDLIEENLGGFREEDVNQIVLNEEGHDYLEKGLPERQLLKILLDSNIKEISIEDLHIKSKLEEQIFYVGLANMKKNRWVAQSKASGENKIFLVLKEFPETESEKFLLKFKKKSTMNYSTLSKKEMEYLDLLNKRKLIVKEKKTHRIIFLTNKGKSIKKSDIEELEQVSKITPEMLSAGTWKNYNLKPFDITKPGPLLKAGKTHPLINLINEIREIFISMGFTEIRGPIVESAFFNFDALFQPQDHPARELQDTFYLNNPKVARLPDRDRVMAVKATHENGGDSGSLGWRYKWNENIAKQTVLRTHTTSTTMRRLAQFYKDNDKTPIKVFCIDRVFRNEKLDKSHLAEFTQVEGIVIDENVNLSDLIGLLSEFYRKMGFKK